VSLSGTGTVTNSEMFNPCSRTGVGNLWLASQMWLFWWRHLARLIFS